MGSSSRRGAGIDVKTQVLALMELGNVRVAHDLRLMPGSLFAS